MSVAEKLKITSQEYLAAERQSETKHEFFDGELFARAGGTRRHSLIAVNVASELNQQLAGKPSQVFNSDLRVKIEATGLYTYPDVQVGCGHLRFEEGEEDTLLNPKIIVEVLSDSTAAWDRGGKFWHYRHLDSLTEYVLVSQEAWQVEHYTRQANGQWLFETLEGAKAVLALPSIKARVPLREIYANTGLKPGAPTRLAKTATTR
ncbi:MAG: Uma2 family endonuclease [Verrucomicrobia bacterium]|nr:Uma2 family endonuclease [Verrucomicrobiota bacterium]